MIDEQTIVNRRYRVERRIGEGGMAQVYLGHDLLLNRAVAIKVLRPQFAHDAAFRTRFEREAQAAAGFTHPNIIDVYDVGEHDATPYIVMEYVRGETLEAIVEAEGPFEADDVAALLEQVCAALDYAHDRGLVHRDVKPHNILVDSQGLAKVVDFGIAKGLADSSLTDAGTGLGTVGYISPEQAAGLMATPASDIYSVAVVAFQMLTQALPFPADSAVGVAMRHVNDPPPPPSAVNPAVPPAVDAIVLRALAKDPTQRYQSAGAFAAAMTGWREGSGADAPVANAGMAPSLGQGAVAANDGAVPGAATVVLPGTTRVDRGAAAAPARAVPLPPARAGAAQPDAVRDDVGCATWAIGSAILIGLVALIWLGFRFSPRLADFASSGDDPTTPPAATATAAAPAAIAATAQTTGAAAAPTATVPPIAAPTGAPTALGVPDLIGLTIPAATDAVNDRGFLLEVDRESVYDPDVPIDAVAEQDPPPDATLEQGGTVLVRRSLGTGRVDIAALNLGGQPAAAARAALEERGLGVDEEPAPSADVAEGNVVGVEPGDAAFVGDTVTLLVSAGDVVTIPAELLGQPVAQAQTALEGLGLAAEPVGVDRNGVEELGLDLDDGTIRDGDVVAVRGNGAELGGFVPPGTEVEIVFYDADSNTR